MGLIVSNIVEVYINKMALWINIRVDDWTVELAIITGNEFIAGLSTCTVGLNSIANSEISLPITISDGQQLTVNCAATWQYSATPNDTSKEYTCSSGNWNSSLADCNGEQFLDSGGAIRSLWIDEAGIYVLLSRPGSQGRCCKHSSLKFNFFFGRTANLVSQSDRFRQSSTIFAKMRQSWLFSWKTYWLHE